MVLKIGTLEADLQLDTSDLDDAERRVRQTGKVVDQSFTKANATANKLASGGLKNSRFAFQQLGFQVQDVAVQLQGGTNALTVLGQQGSQIASIFGPGGAVIGALLAVASAIAGALIPSLFSSKDATEQLEEALKELDETAIETEGGIVALTNKIIKLAQESERAARAEISSGILTSLEAIKIASKEASSVFDNELGRSFNLIGRQNRRTAAQIREVSKAFEITTDEAKGVASAIRDFNKESTPENAARLQRAVDDIAVTYGETNPKVIALSASLREQTKVIEDEEQRLKLLRRAFQDIGSVVAESEEATRGDAGRRREESQQAIIDRRIDQIRRLGESEREALDNQYTITREFINSQDQLTEAERTQLLEAAAIDRGKKLAAIENAQNSLRINAAAQFSNALLTVLKRAGKEETALGKAAFLATQAVSVANIIANSEVAAAKALAINPIANQGLAAFIRGAGYASAGLVGGLAVADTFEDGGIVGGQSFTGDQVLARVNSGEMILNRSQQAQLFKVANGAQSGGMPNIVINNNAPGVRVSAQSISRDEVMLMVKQSEDSAVSRVDTSLSRGQGSTARALRSGFKTERNTR